MGCFLFSFFLTSQGVRIFGRGRKYNQQLQKNLQCDCVLTVITGRIHRDNVCNEGSDQNQCVFFFNRVSNCVLHPKMHVGNFEIVQLKIHPVKVCFLLLLLFYMCCFKPVWEKT